MCAFASITSLEQQMMVLIKNNIICAHRLLLSSEEITVLHKVSM